MRRNIRRLAPEINLTPLLDVLFSILFIVMMTGMQNEKNMQTEYRTQAERLEQEFVKKEREMDGLKEELEKLSRQIESYDLYQAEAVILTVYNETRSGRHFLVIREGLENGEVDRILLGADRIENASDRIREAVSVYIKETDKQPVYIVFYCDKEQIYTTEYKAVTDTFWTLQEKNKEVFFKLTEDER